MHLRCLVQINIKELFTCKFASIYETDLKLFACWYFLFHYFAVRFYCFSHLTFTKSFMNAIRVLLFLLCFRARLFIDALWWPVGKGLTSWLSFVMSNCEFVTFPLVSWVRCGVWLYRFLIFALFHTFNSLYPHQVRLLLVWVYTCQNATLLKITCHGSFLIQEVTKRRDCWIFFMLMINIII